MLLKVLKSKNIYTSSLPIVDLATDQSSGGDFFHFEEFDYSSEPAGRLGALSDPEDGRRRRFVIANDRELSLA